MKSPQLRFLASAFVLAGAAPALLCCAAHADIGVALADPTTIGVSNYTHAGHSVVYLSGVCAETPVRARLCHPGEQGSIVTMYPNLYEDKPYSWNIVPLSLFVNGFPQPGERLLYSSQNVKQAMQDQARATYLKPVCSGEYCQERAHAYWRDLVASTVDRDIFVYAVSSTAAEDQSVVDWLNGAANINRYNTFTNNCSNFTEALINNVFPHSVRRDMLNDLAMMSPKAATRSFTRWARKRPGTGLYAIHFAQLPGAVPRSGIARSGTEDAIHMKKYLIPAALIGDHEVAGSFFVAYYLTGRFNLYKEYTRDAAEGDAALETEAVADQKHGHDAEALVLRADAQAGRDAVLGATAQWDDYRERFRRLGAAPDLRPMMPVGHPDFFPAWFAKASVTVDSEGEPWMSTQDGEGLRVGLSTRNLLVADSDPKLAAQLMLGRVAYALAAKNHYRETMPEFQQDWELLMQTVDRFRATPNFSMASKVASGASAPVAQATSAAPVQ